MKKPEGVKEVLDIQVMSKYVIIALVAMFMITAGCSVSRKEVNIEEHLSKRNIDYTLYDLTYVEGIKEKMKGNMSEAIDKFEDAIEINPESDAANYQISQIAAMRRDYENAIKYGKIAYTLDRKNPWYMMHMANIYIQISELDTAALWLEKTVEIEKGNENEKYRLGNIYMQTGQVEKAEKIFQEFYDKYPGNEQIIMALIDAKIKIGKQEETEEIIRNELKKNTENIKLKGLLAEVYAEMGKKEQAEELYDEIIEEEQYDMAVNFSYIEFLLKNQEYDKLTDRIEGIILDEGTIKENKIGLIARIMQDSVMIEKYPDKIIEIGTKLLGEYEDDPTVVLLVAEISVATGNTEKGIETLADYIKRNEEQYYVWEKLLLILNENNQVDKLFQYASKASSIFNTAPLPKIFYAFALIERKKYDEASEELRKVRILVNNEERYLVQILAMEAEIAYRKDDIKKAFEKFDNALDIEPENTLILNNYAYYLAEKELRMNEAQNMIERCLDIEENITYLDTYAWVLYKRGKYREAEKVMSRIFGSGNIADGELIEHYGYIKKALGRCEDAIALWQSALRIDENKTYLIEEIRKCIEKE